MDCFCYGTNFSSIFSFKFFICFPFQTEFLSPSSQIELFLYLVQKALEHCNRFLFQLNLLINDFFVFWLIFFWTSFSLFFYKIFLLFYQYKSDLICFRCTIYPCFFTVLQKQVLASLLILDLSKKGHCNLHLFMLLYKKPRNKKLNWKPALFL